MKYGLVMHKTTSNFGDDIQSYAISRFLPQIDYYIDREETDSFQSENGEPVAVIMAAWWLWKKWNWPPSEVILPLLTSIHVNNDSIEHGASPAGDKWVDGIGGEYLSAYGPVGARDLFSLRFFNEHGIDAYLSGCITLTLPKQPQTEAAGTYICIVDLNEKCSKKARILAQNAGLNVIELTHNCAGIGDEMEESSRLERAQEYLQIYQNAKVVITRRLHVSLPCLAMEVPVLAVLDVDGRANVNRWDAYKEYIYHVTQSEFLSEAFQYDIMNPPPNNEGYQPLRENLIKQVESFIDHTAGLQDNNNLSLKKTNYTSAEAYDWQHRLMKEVLSEWLYQNRAQNQTMNQLKAENKNLRKQIKVLEEQLEAIHPSKPIADNSKRKSGMKGLFHSLKERIH